MKVYYQISTRVLKCEKTFQIPLEKTIPKNSPTKQTKTYPTHTQTPLPQITKGKKRQTAHNSLITP